MPSNDLKIPKWCVALLGAAAYLLFSHDWCAPGWGLQWAAEWLGLLGNDDAPFPLWGQLVRLAGRDIPALIGVSFGSAILVMVLLAVIFGDLFARAVKRAREAGVAGETEFAFVQGVGVLLVCGAFLFTPGFLVAAIGVDPLMTLLLPPLASIALVVRVALGSGTVAERLKRRKGHVLLALSLAGYSAYELLPMGRFLLASALVPILCFIGAGVMPALVVARYVRLRTLAARNRQIWAFGVWALLVVTLVAVNGTSGTFIRGRAANRIVGRIIDNARGCSALVSAWPLDVLLMFVLPEEMQLVSLERDRDPQHGRELAAWMKGAMHGDDDLVFAAGLGPRALLEDWERKDAKGFKAAVRAVADYFPTRESWESTCDLLDDMRSDEPFAGSFRRLLGVCGTHVGCRLLENGDLSSAWAVFRRIADRGDRENYAAILNLSAMLDRGYAAPGPEAKSVVHRREMMESRLKTMANMARAAHAGGRVYLSRGEKERYQKLKGKLQEDRKLTPEAQAFLETVNAAPNDPKSGRAAQEAIRKALAEGSVSLAAIGDRLITIDLALGDTESAEKDALEVLRLNRHDPVANALMGSLSAKRGDDETAERYLRRAVATGNASVAAKNDLACALSSLERFAEAEPFAREAVKRLPYNCNVHETLAAVLIRSGKLDEGERVLQKAEELAKKANVNKSLLMAFEFDRAWLFRLRGDRTKFGAALRILKKRQNLTDRQKRELAKLEK